MKQQAFFPQHPIKPSVAVNPLICKYSTGRSTHNSPLRMFQETKHVYGQLYITSLTFSPKMITPDGKDGSVKLKIEK